MNIKKFVAQFLIENPDYVTIGKLKLRHDNQDARAFAYYKGDMIVGYDEEEWHRDFVDNVTREQMDLPGRLWLGHETISFWKYPKDKRELDKVIKDINAKLKEQGDDVRIKGDWAIEVYDDDKKPKLISVKDYSDKYYTEIDTKVDHQLSPMLKKKKEVPIGVGSEKDSPSRKPGETMAAYRARTQQESIIKKENTMKLTKQYLRKLIKEEHAKLMKEGIDAHYHIEGDKTYVDSSFINACQRIIPDSELKHMGFGEFYLQTPDGEIQFDRMRGKPFEGQSGRSHLMYDDKDGELVQQLIDGMESEGKAVAV